MADDYSFYAARALEAIQQACFSIQEAYTRPCVVHKACLERSQNGWFANLGPVKGFGKSPEEAMADFDKAWVKKSS